jgi:phosphate transport system substrate-binding protein
MYKLCILAMVVAAASGCSKRKHEGGGTGGPGHTGGTTASTGGGGPIKVDGSSTVFLVSQAVAEDFQKAGKGTVTVGESGTGGGFQKFCRGEVDVAGASRPIKTSEAEACKRAGIEWIELPIAYDGIAVMVHPKNTFVDKLTVEELKRIWAPDSRITRWKDVRAGFPDKPLRLFGAGTDSGTYDYFTQAIVGKEHSSRGDFTANEDDNVLVQGIAGDESALGFFGFGYYAENKDKLKLVPIDDGKDENGAGAIAPSPETIANGTYQPLSRPIFIYASTKAIGKSEVDAFVTYYLDNTRKLSAEVGYVALPARADELAKVRYTARKTGSMFAGGSKVGVTMESLMSAEGAK